MISEWIAAIFLLIGALFMLIASIGIVRFQDIYLRMHAATKAPSLGVLLMITGVVIYFASWWILAEGLLIILFIFMTAPIGSHVLARVAHMMHVKKCKETFIDELLEQSDEQQSPDKKSEK
jgi:multicomponent Na+:H+ antiporter subunit G